MKLDRVLYRMHRWISWVILPFMIVIVVSGYAYLGKIRGFHRGLAFDLHTKLDLPLILLIVAHVLLAGRFELMRFKIKGKAVDVFLLVLGIIVALAVIYVELKGLR